MFSLFRRAKPTEVITHVAPLVGATLQQEAAFPDLPRATPVTASDPHGRYRCERLRLSGQPPLARFVGDDGDGQTSTAYRLEHAGTPLAIVNRDSGNRSFEVWELDPHQPQSFVRQRSVVYDAEPGNWFARIVVEALCLPREQALLAVTYWGQGTRTVIYRYHVGSNTLNRLGPAELNTEDLATYFSGVWLGPDAAIVRFGSDQRTTSPETYLNARNHFLLYSNDHPEGLELLTLGSDHGQLTRWAATAQTLWLETADPRKPGSARSTWSLPLQAFQLAPPVTAAAKGFRDAQ